MGRMSQTRPGIADARQLAAAHEPSLLPDFNVARVRLTMSASVRDGHSTHRSAVWSTRSWIWTCAEPPFSSNQKMIMVWCCSGSGVDHGVEGCAGRPAWCPVLWGHSSGGW